MRAPKVSRLNHWRAYLLLAVAVLCYVASVRGIRADGRPRVEPELLVSLPRFAQVLMAGGDRYLAANLAGFRVLVASTERMKADDYAVQARLQRDIAWLNPAHEDNYYIASSILPWNAQLESAQWVLRRAADGRPYDWLPLFHFGFNLYHFKQDPIAGAQAIAEAIPRAAKEPSDQWALQNLAAKWVERGYETATAANVVEAMARSSARGSFRNYLHARALRLRQLAELRQAAAMFRTQKGRAPQSLSELVAMGLVAELPVDPLGSGYTLDKNGNPIFAAGFTPR